MSDLITVTAAGCSLWAGTHCLFVKWDYGKGPAWSCG